MKKRQLIGILNCTPDSYFEGGRCPDPAVAIEYGLRLIEEGADILDIGGESTSPFSSSVPEAVEIQRVIPVIKGLRKQTNHPLSIDTFKPKVALKALDAGVDWINDVTGLENPEMQKAVRDSQVRCCLMHSLSPPHTPPPPYNYPQGVVKEISRFFESRVELLLNNGLLPSQIVLDPGIGGGSFGKTPEQSLAILKDLNQFTKLGFPLLISLSRKSFMQKILKKTASELLSTTLALNTMAILEGASFIRVHDVAAHRDILTLFEKMETQ